MENKGVVTVISGFSGTGKGTVIGELMKRYDNYCLSISATTRAPREGEQDGREYFFKTTEEFEAMIRDKKLIEYVKYIDHYYGTPKDYVVEQMERGKDVILEIEMRGALRVKEILPEAQLVFLTPPSGKELERRLYKRGTESEEQIHDRLEQSKKEWVYMKEYDYIVINDELDTCVTQVHQLIQSMHYQRDMQEGLIRKIHQELEKLP